MPKQKPPGKTTRIPSKPYTLTSLWKRKSAEAPTAEAPTAEAPIAEAATETTTTLSGTPPAASDISPATCKIPTATATSSSNSASKKFGAARYRTPFNKLWTKTYAMVREGSTKYHYWCSTCRVENGCDHQGLADVKRHCTGAMHLQKIKILEANKKIQPFTVPEGPQGMSPQEIMVIMK